MFSRTRPTMQTQGNTDRETKLSNRSAYSGVNSTLMERKYRQISIATNVNPITTHRLTLFL